MRACRRLSAAEAAGRQAGGLFPTCTAACCDPYAPRSHKCPGPRHGQPPGGACLRRAGRVRRQLTSAAPGRAAAAHAAGLPQRRHPPPFLCTPSLPYQTTHPPTCPTLPYPHPYQPLNRPPTHPPTARLGVVLLWAQPFQQLLRRLGGGLHKSEETLRGDAGRRQATGREGGVMGDAAARLQHPHRSARQFSRPPPPTSCCRTDGRRFLPITHSRLFAPCLDVGHSSMKKRWTSCRDATSSLPTLGLSRGRGQGRAVGAAGAGQARGGGAAHLYRKVMRPCSRTPGWAAAASVPWRAGAACCAASCSCSSAACSSCSSLPPAGPPAGRTRRRAAAWGSGAGMCLWRQERVATGGSANAWPTCALPLISAGLLGLCSLLARCGHLLLGLPQLVSAGAVTPLGGRLGGGGRAALGASFDRLGFCRVAIGVLLVGSLPLRCLGCVRLSRCWLLLALCLLPASGDHCCFCTHAENKAEAHEGTQPGRSAALRQAGRTSLAQPAPSLESRRWTLPSPLGAANHLCPRYPACVCAFSKMCYTRSLNQSLLKMFVWGGMK